MLDELADGLDARGPRELVELGELLVGIGAVGEDGDREPALRRCARSRIGLARRHRPIMPVQGRIPPWPTTWRCARSSS